MTIWKHNADIEAVRKHLAGTMCEHVGIELTEIGPDFITGTMPVDARTFQNRGILHGGASVVLAETLGSIAATLCCPEGYFIVGLEINANHVRAGKPPQVTGIARPLHIGSSTMVWDIRITNTDGKLVCVSRLTTAVLKER